MTSAYRILKVSWRHDEDASIRHFFKVQYLTTNIFGKQKWKDYKKLVMEWGDIYKEIVTFDNGKIALEYINNLCKNVPPDEVVPLFSFKFSDDEKK